MDERVMDRDFIIIRGQQIRLTTAQRGWRCGLCGARLTMRPLMNEAERRCEWQLVCIKNPNSHDKENFIHDATWQRREYEARVNAQMAQIAQKEYGFMLKDRMEKGTTIPQRTRLPRVGRIRLGRRRTPTEDDRRFMTNEDHFIIDPITDDPVKRENMIGSVLAGISEFLPAQEPGEIHALPITFLSPDREVFGSASYKKRRGQRGTVWCAGDGEFIQWKLSNDFRQEVVGGFKYGTDERISCPGRNRENWHEWCFGTGDDKKKGQCKPELELSFAIIGAESTGVWMMRTGDMLFYDILQTQLNIAEGLVASGVIRSIVGVPFILTRYMDQRSVPIGEATEEAGAKLTDKEMPVMSIRIEDTWLRLRMAEHRASDYMIEPPSPAQAVYSGDAGFDEAVDEAQGEWTVPPDSFLVEVPSGVHGGKSLGWLAKNEPEYLQKIAEKAQDPEMRLFAEQVLNYVPF